MTPLSRRQFLLMGCGGLFTALPRQARNIMTVDGSITPQQMGRTLVHEHFLVDFIGADKITETRWSRAAVVAKVLPYLAEAKRAGVKTIVDCTPAFLGRDVKLLQQLAAKSGLQIITNTGYYGAVDNKYLPPWAFTESAENLAARWITETNNGIDGTSVKPGFIKMSVDAKEPLSDLHQKLVQAAALTHLQTGLTIFSHTGPAAAALQQIGILQKAGVDPSAFVWVHAQNETELLNHSKLARMGAWVSLDGIGWGDTEPYINALVFLKKQKLLHRVVISHDAGWYKPDEPGATFQPYTAIFKTLVPALKKKGFHPEDFKRLMVTNPAEVMQIRKRKR